MFRSALPLLSMLAALSCGAAHAAPLPLQLKAEALVAGPRIQLADVVQADGTLPSLDLGAAPLPGYSARLARAELERMLRSRGMQGQFTVAGADAVRIERRAQAADSNALVETALQHLRRHLEHSLASTGTPAGSARIELHMVGAAPEVQLAQGRVEWRPQALPADFALRSRMQVTVDAWVDGAYQRSVSVPFQVSAWAPALVATRALPAGAAPGCESLAVQQVDLATLDGATAGTDCARLQGRLKRALPAGTPLAAAWMQRPAAVAQGDNIALRLQQGAIELESRAVALSDGEVGQRIDVRPTASQQAVRAEIIAPGLARITGQ